MKSYMRNGKLRECVGLGMNESQASARIGRSIGACLSRARDMGIPFPIKQPQVREPWPYEDQAEAKARDEAYVRKVLKANVYGFGNTVLVDVKRLMQR